MCVWSDSSLTARYTWVSLLHFKGVWHKFWLLNYLWVDTRLSKTLSAHTSLIGQYLLKPWQSEKPAQALWLKPQTSGYTLDLECTCQLISLHFLR